MKEHAFRSTLVIRRLSYFSLLKIFCLGGIGLIVPFCGLGLLFAVFSPSNVHLQEGQTMLGFILMLLALMVLWPLFFAFFFGTAAWLAMGIKSLFDDTSIEVVQDDRDLAP